jgi:hypothetical protein
LTLRPQTMAYYNGIAFSALESTDIAWAHGHFSLEKILRPAA